MSKQKATFDEFFDQTDALDYDLEADEDIRDIGDEPVSFDDFVSDSDINGWMTPEEDIEDGDAVLDRLDEELDEEELLNNEELDEEFEDEEPEEDDEAVEQLKDIGIDKEPDCECDGCESLGCGSRHCNCLEEFICMSDYPLLEMYEDMLETLVRHGMDFEEAKECLEGTKLCSEATLEAVGVMQDILEPTELINLALQVIELASKEE